MLGKFFDPPKDKLKITFFFVSRRRCAMFFFCRDGKIIILAETATFFLLIGHFEVLSSGSSCFPHLFIECNSPDSH